MGKACGVSKRRKKKYNYKHRKNLKRIHKKLLTLPKVRCKQLKESWNSSKTYRQNMAEMGLADDSNKSVLPSEKKKRKPVKMEVVRDLEAEATQLQPKTLRLPTEPIKFCVYMIEKHGEDYKAMAKDPKNYYQCTPAEIRKKIKKFKSVPCQWNGYLRAKGLLDSEASPNEYQINVNDIVNSTGNENAPMEQ